MCGIAGLFTTERPVDAELVAAVLRMLDAEVHRGPDDWGILIPDSAMRQPGVRSLLEQRGLQHVSTYPGGDGVPAAVLGTRRLSIIDLSPAGRMPMASHDGRVWVTYNGEIYNFPELRTELESKGYSFRSTGDTEVLVHGYSEWGADVVHRLRGMFAFAIVDARGQRPRLFLARDRFGIKPLYWVRQAGVFQFASEVRALTRSGLIDVAPEPRALHGFLAFGSVPAPWTTVRGVLALPPAHHLEVDDVSYSSPRPKRYWTMPALGTRRIAWNDAVAEVRHLLSEAVRLHLVSDVPLGVFLSGGMDSGALVGLAARHAGQPLTTLSVTFDEAEFSEGEEAAAVARRFGTKHVDIRLRADQFIDEIPKIFNAMDQPSTDGVNTYFVAKAAREAGLTVVLSGVGGDEMFWGYPGFSRARDIGRLAKIAPVRFAASLAGRLLAALGHPRFEKLEFLGEDPLLGAYLSIRGLFPPRRAAALLGGGRLPLPPLDGEDRGRLTPETYSRLEIQHYLANQLLRDTDVFGMAHNLEVRVPFLDHRLAEAVLSLPVEHLQPRNGLQKPLLAHAVSADHPDIFGARAKMGFTFPFDLWMRDSADDIMAFARAQTPVAERPFHELARMFRSGRLHWSRFWSVAVLRAMSGQGLLPPWDPTPTPRKILFLLPQVYGSKGGIPVYNEQLLRAAGEALPGAELRALSLNDDRLPSDAAIGGRVHFIGVGPRTRRGRRAEFVLRAISAALRSRPDLIVCGHLNVAGLGWAVAAITRRPAALLAYGIEAWAPPAHARWVARRMARVLSVSRFTAEQMMKWGVRAERIHLLPGTVDGQIFRPIRCHRENAAPTLLTVARLASSERYKGIDRVLNVLPRVRRALSGTRYVVAGEGDDLPRLRRLAESLGVADATEFLGFVPEDELPGLYNAADLFVMPSVKEGFGIVFLEAMACGTPAVAGNADGSVDALLGGRLGRLVDPNDDGALIDAIVDGLASRGTQGARERIRERVLAEYGFDRFRTRVGEALTVA